MKTLRSYPLSFSLAAGALAALALPQSASAQLVGGFMRSGAVVQGQPVPQRPTQVQPSIPTMMRPGPVVRGNYPVYGQRPAYGGTPVQSRPVFNSTVTIGHAPVYNPQPTYGQGGYNNGYSNYNNSNYNNGYGSSGYGNYSGSGPVVTIPDGSYYPSGGSYGATSYGTALAPPVGPGNGFFHNPVPPVGPGNGYFHNPVPPVGPANGYFSGQAPITGGGPALLGGYYYGGYCNDGGGRHEYRSVYSNYGGFPQYIYSPNVIVVGNDYAPDYAAPSLPFVTPVYQTTYNQNNYYVATPERADELQAGGAQAKAALEHAYPASSFQAAFADIAQAWTDGDIDLIRKHLRDNDTRVSVFLDGKYSYSIASSDFSQITRDALDKLHTDSFRFTRIRKLKNGDVTAFGSHVYRASDTAAGMDSSGTVPFDQAGDGSTDGDSLGTAKTIYVSYTLRRTGTEWDIVATDSANHDLASSKAAE